TWVHLDTLEKNRDDKFTYYEAKTNTLSVFAITGLKGVATAVESYPQVTETSLPAETAETPTEKVPGFGIVLAMVTISALYMLRKGKK
ncbi:MAG: hypothetical protein Q7T55_19410, partial [Solirubrobacteraceae bacterium]|nr:hypothetical protein [Solirubrobacteraceae bacterium]